MANQQKAGGKPALYVTIPEGESIERRLDVQGEHIVLATGGVRRRAGAPQYRYSWKVDFTGVTNSERLQLAARTVVIAWQEAWRNLPNEAERLAWKPPTVREWLDSRGTRAPRDPYAGVKAQLAGCANEAEKLAKLRELGLL